MESDTPYVLVIHGTGSAPEQPPRRPRWYQANNTDPNSFRCVLEEELTSHGITGSVWRDYDDASVGFGWSGDNAHHERTKGGDNLCAEWVDITRRDRSARIHIVAHSHGGNVTLYATQQYLKHLGRQADAIVQEAAELCSTLNPSRLMPAAGAAKAIEKVTGTAAGAAQRYFPEATLELQRVLEEAIEQQPVRKWLLKLREPFAPDASREENDKFVSRFPSNLEISQSQSKSFHDLWVTSRESNRLGKQVFLGTPFFKKIWEQRKWWDPTSLRKLFVNATGLILLAAVGGYLILLLAWGIVWLFVLIFGPKIGWSPFYTPEPNPFLWPPSARLLYAVYAFLPAAVLFIWLFAQKPRSGNPYFDDLPGYAGGGSPGSRVFPLKLLVVTAELLDEVILGFSSEPLVAVELGARLKGWTSWKGLRSGYAIGEARDINGWLAFFVRGMVAIPSVLLAWPLVRFGYVASKSWQLLSSVSFGLSTREFSGSIVTVDHVFEDDPERPVFDQHVWDVTQQLLEPSASAEDRKARYKFLWDEEELQQRLSQSKLWERVEQQKSDIDGRNRRFGLPGAEREARLKRACVMLEERYREMIGLVGLSHSAYYDDRRITRAIAAFIAAGVVPDASTPVGKSSAAARA